MIKAAATSSIDGSADLNKKEYGYYRNRKTTHRSQIEYDQELVSTE
jgi:hypothetical protein